VANEKLCKSSPKKILKKDIELLRFFPGKNVAIRSPFAQWIVPAGATIARASPSAQCIVPAGATITRAKK
jgi:hypothetical protein